MIKWFYTDPHLSLYWEHGLVIFLSPGSGMVFSKYLLNKCVLLKNCLLLLGLCAWSMPFLPRKTGVSEQEHHESHVVYLTEPLVPRGMPCLIS